MDIRKSVLIGRASTAMFDLIEAADACRIDLEMSYAFGGALLGQIAGPIFDAIANTMVDAFAKRAEETACPASAS